MHGGWYEPSTRSKRRYECHDDSLPDFSGPQVDQCYCLVLVVGYVPSLVRLRGMGLFRGLLCSGGVHCCAVFLARDVGGAGVRGGAPAFLLR